jgi:hypothetical protein
MKQGMRRGVLLKSVLEQRKEENEGSKGEGRMFRGSQTRQQLFASTGMHRFVCLFVTAFAVRTRHPARTRPALTCSSTVGRISSLHNTIKHEAEVMHHRCRSSASHSHTNLLHTLVNQNPPPFPRPNMSPSLQNIFSPIPCASPPESQYPHNK